MHALTMEVWYNFAAAQTPEGGEVLPTGNLFFNLSY